MKRRQLFGAVASLGLVPAPVVAIPALRSWFRREIDRAFVAMDQRRLPEEFFDLTSAQLLGSKEEG